ncbi:MAG: sugar ABC transporter ATP-binding protein [Gammaproteobacteria bacterium]|nr:sugar ABC transporter ATP-binding protein [Gammaproteobacteria bacterium]
MNNSSSGKNSVLLSADNVAKSFGDVEVLHGISLALRAGEVRAILGENGAGKSTLVKILAGFERPSGGQLKYQDLDGQIKSIDGWLAEEAEANGVVLIHQELNLADQLTVSENIFLGQELRRGLFLDKRQMDQKSREYLDSLHCKVDTRARVGDLPVSAKQLIEIARTRAKRARVLIMDEPTAVLTRQESEVLYELIARLSAEGVAVVFISHKLEEIERIADSITILRDGQLVGDYAAKDLSREDMVSLMVGREIGDLFPAKRLPEPQAPKVLEVRELLVRGTDSPCSFALQQGEILGFSGLVGSGRTALLESVVGLRSPATDQPGSVSLFGQPVRIKNLAQARELGMAYLTKDRKGSGLLLEKGLAFNFSLFALQKFSRGVINRNQEQEAFSEAVENFDIRIKDAGMSAGNLSGGNQQKLLLAKVLESEPRVVIIDEPTRGIDIGTKSQIYHFIAELADSGHAVVVISSDIVEIIGLCHRVAVMFHGRLTGIVSGADINEEEIMAYATGLKDQQQSSSDKPAATGVN